MFVFNANSKIDKNNLFSTGNSVCSYPMLFHHGRLAPSKFEYELNESVKVECDHGYSTVKTMILCGENGVWSENVTCKIT